MFLSKIIETKMGNYIYDALNNKIVKLPELVYKELKEGEGFCYKNYYKFIKENNLRNFMKQIEFNIDCDFSINEMLKWSVKNAMNSITLCVTESCNLCCEYCIYIKKYKNNKHIPKNMPKEIAFKAIDFLMRNSKTSNHVGVGFYGGEPLLMFDLIKDCINYCKEIYPFKIPIYSITTNGLLLGSGDIIEFMIENNFNILVSLDGTKESHNEHRLDKNGVPCFDKVFANLHKLYKRDPAFFKSNLGFSSVRTLANFNETQYDFLDNLCSSYVFITASKNTKHFEKILQNKLKSREIKTIDILQYNFVRRNVLTSLKKYHDCLKNEIQTKDIFPGSYCMPGVNKNFIKPDGKIVLCERVNENNSLYILGDVFTGIRFDKIKNLINLTLNKVKKYQSCWASKLASFCFKDILDLNDKHCKKCSEEVYSSLKYYIEEIRSNREVVAYLENMFVG